jgi:catechol 2,3-dioxygenase-like lactoylglutathione lyase family enzyme
MNHIQLHHVGLLMPTEEAAQQFMKLIGLEEDYRGYVPEYKALCIFAKGNGASPVELVIPQGGKLSEYKPGKPVIHHLAFAVDDVRVAQAEYAAKAMPLLNEQPVQGAGDFLVNFLKPRHTGGILVEFVQNTR